MGEDMKWYGRDAVSMGFGNVGRQATEDIFILVPRIKLTFPEHINFLNNIRISFPQRM
jgi:hypothetical protein